MTKKFTRLGIMSVTAITASSLGLGGLASAASIDTTGPGSSNIIRGMYSYNTRYTNNNSVQVTNENDQTATTGSATSSGNTYGGSGMNDLGDWNDWDPMTWQQDDRNFSDWWSGMMSHLGHYDSSDWTTYGSSGNGNDWSPSGNNWQDDWSNWNPHMWQQNGQSYSDWYGHILGYMTGDYTHLMNDWDNGGQGGSTNSGNGDNDNGFDAGVGISNGSSAQNDSSQESDGVGGASIFLTGPGSTNVIENDYESSFETTNNNDVDISSDNDQSASSGDASSSGNTVGGSAESGNAGNQNDSETDVEVVNSTSDDGWMDNGSNNGGGSSISTTGPRSENTISSSYERSYTSTNNNDVSIINTSSQSAESGDASSTGNTIGGDAESGSAMNSNSSRSYVEITNS